MKYFSKKIRNEYGEFDSKAEFERYLHLKHLEDIGVISWLKRQDTKEGQDRTQDKDKGN